MGTLVCCKIMLGFRFVTKLTMFQLSIHSTVKEIQGSSNSRQLVYQCQVRNHAFIFLSTHIRPHHHIPTRTHKSSWSSVMSYNVSTLNNYPMLIDKFDCFVLQLGGDVICVQPLHLAIE